MDKTENMLINLSADFFDASNLTSFEKKKFFSTIQKDIAKNKSKLQELIMDEVKFTLKDADKEINRAVKTFAFAEKNSDFSQEKEFFRNDKRIVEKRLARGPLLVITPFSSPLSSPAHKISSGLLAGTSIVFKPSPLAKQTGKFLFELISKATNGRYVFFYDEDNIKDLERVVADERIGIISFTGGYKTGKRIIQVGGVKKYHMELEGGNSCVIFSPEYTQYDNQLSEKLIEGVIAKNGQRCVSLKHIFIALDQASFIDTFCEKLNLIKEKVKQNFDLEKRTILGPLITVGYAKKTEEKVAEILKYDTLIKPLIKMERKEDYVFPTLYSIHEIHKNLIEKVLKYDLPGPILFIHYYKNNSEYEQILDVLKNDYIQSGLQLSFYTKNFESINKMAHNLLWGGIIINDLPTYRDEYMAFGGFGRAGLGKEGFFETVLMYTDPQVLVFPEQQVIK